MYSFAIGLQLKHTASSLELQFSVNFCESCFYLHANSKKRVLKKLVGTLQYQSGITQGQRYYLYGD